jgi:phosphonate transport system permease protein
VWTWVDLGIDLRTLLDGIEDVRALLDRMLPPRFTGLGHTLDLAVQTFFMAFLATAVASVLSTPIAVLAARNTTPHPAVGLAARAVIVVARAIPDVVFALVFVRAVGIGPLPGVLAMSLHSIGMIGKLYADTVEQIDEAPRDAVLATGAGPVQTLATAVFPQVLPSFIGTSLYRLDINLRISVILGVVGAGGIGFELQASLRQLSYARGMGIVCVIAAMIVLVELVSAAVRRSIIGEGGGVPAARSRRRGAGGAAVVSRASAGPGDAAPIDSPVDEPAPVGVAARPGGLARGALRPPWTRHRVVSAGYVGLLLALSAGAFLSVELSPVELVTSLPDIVSTVGRMFPPDFSTASESMRAGLVETLSIAVAATALGLVLTAPLGFLSARNVAPHPAVYVVARAITLAVRSVPDLILAIIFVSAIGLGPVPGVFALAVSTVGFMAKLMADGLEEIDSAPREAVLSTGATRLQEAATSVVPQALPSFVSSAIYTLDVNIRTSIVLGIVGAGGIGFLLNNSVRTLQLQTTSAIIILLFAVVYALELLAGWVRRAII